MRVCASCFRDEEIRGFIRAQSNIREVCKYCSHSDSLIAVEELLDFFVKLLSMYKENSKGVPLIDAIQKDWKIFFTKTIGKSVLSDLLKQLNLYGYSSFDLINSSSRVTYLDEICDCVNLWNEIKEDIKWKRRYLTEIEKLEEQGWDAFFNNSFVLDSGYTLYRARINKDGKKKPCEKNEIWMPPKQATLAGRANPQGIPYLYLCTEEVTTLYETRGTFLDYVSIGIFQVKKGNTVKLVDFAGKRSPFNNTDSMIDFIKSELVKKEISKDLSKPLSRYDTELEYIPTQFICEYIRYLTQSDGILFQSSLFESGKNVVLFNPDYMECISVELHQITNVRIKSKKIR